MGAFVLLILKSLLSQEDRNISHTLNKRTIISIKLNQNSNWKVIVDILAIIPYNVSYTAHATIDQAIFSP